MEYIESTENKRVKEWAALLSKKNRKTTGKFLFESRRGIEEALLYGAKPLEILLREGTELPAEYQQHLQGVALATLASKVFGKLSLTENTQGIIGVFPCKQDKLKYLLGLDCLLFLDGIQDPGNLGTIVRSAAAFGVKGLLLGPGCVDLYNDKVLRSTLGGLFALSIVDLEYKDLNLLKKHGFTLVGSDLQGVSIETFQWPEKTIVGIGNENKGLSQEFRELASQYLTIPQNSPMESLNAGVAASIIMYKYSR